MSACGRSKYVSAYRSGSSSRETAASSGYQWYPANTSSAPCPLWTTFTSLETCSDSRWKATTSWLIIGSLIAATASSRAAETRLEGTIIRRWSVPNSRATRSE